MMLCVLGAGPGPGEWQEVGRRDREGPVRAELGLDPEQCGMLEGAVCSDLHVSQVILVSVWLMN